MKKAIKIILLVVVILFAGLIAVPFIFKDKILALVKTEINNNINAKVDFKSFDLSIFKSFPHLTFSLNELTVAGIKEFEGDTLAGMKSFAISVNLMSVIKGDKIQIRSIHLEVPRIRLLVLKDGKANWDIVKSDDSTSTSTEESSGFEVGLQKYSIDNGRIFYEDASIGFSMLMEEMNHKGNGDFTQDLFLLSTNTEMKKLTVSYGGMDYISEARSILDADLEMDMVKSKYIFKKNELKLNELALGFDGYVAMPGEDIEMDLKFDVKQNEFKNFISMIPGVYRDGFDNVQSSGTLKFNGFVKGIYNETSMPGFEVILAIDNGKFRYPDLPSDLKNVFVDLKVSNPDGVPDNTIINLQKLHFDLGSDPFDAKMIVKTPVSDADIDVSVKGKINLANISKIVPLEAGTEMSGMLNADVTAKGRMSAIDEKRYQDFEANGLINLTSFNYKSSEFQQGVSIQVCELIFNPKNVTLNKFDLKSGRTDLKATGWIDNLISYTFKENELLKGTLDIKSGTIDLNEILGEPTATTTTDTVPMEIIEVPENLDFLITANIGKIFYDDLELLNTKGNIAIRDRTLGINGVSFNMLDGSVNMDGLYETKNIKSPFFFFDLGLTQMDIRKVYDKFVAVQKFAPIAEMCSGKFSTEFDVKGNLDSKMAPVYNTLTGGGKLTTKSVKVENFPPFVKVADALKMEQYKKMNLSDVNISFKFENGRVNIDPFDIEVEDINTNISGSNGFDQTIDYNVVIAVPVSKMGSSANNAISGLITKANKETGSNLSMGKEVKVKVKITGTVTDPKIETGLKDAAGSVVTDVKEQLKDEFDQKKKELENQAKAEAERLKNEAEQKARAEAERLKKEAEDKVKSEADRLKKETEQKVKKDAEDKLKDMFGKPKK